MPPPERVPLWEGPAPEEGTPRISGEPSRRKGIGAHVAKRALTAGPRPRNNPPTSARSFVSRRYKSRGDPRSRTGLQCGKVVVTGGAQGTGINKYLYKGLRMCGGRIKDNAK